MSTAQKIAEIIKKRMIYSDEIDRVSDLLTEVSNKHVTVDSGEYTVIFSPLEGEVKDCLWAECRSKGLTWSAQLDKNHETPMQFLSKEEKRLLGKNLRKMGMKCKIEAKSYYIVTINNCRVTRHFDHGTIEGIEFPQSLVTNLFEDAETAEEEKRKFIKYYRSYQAWKNLPSNKRCGE